MESRARWFELRELRKRLGVKYLDPQDEKSLDVSHSNTGVGYQSCPMHVVPSSFPCRIRKLVVFTSLTHRRPPFPFFPMLLLVGGKEKVLGRWISLRVRGSGEVGGNLGVARLQLLFFFPSRFVN